MNITIRKAEKKDALCITQAEKEIAQEEGYLCSEPSELNETAVSKMIDCPLSIFLVAECEGQIVGHAFLKTSSLNSLRYVADLNIAIHLGFQSKGIGKQLLSQLIDEAKHSSIEKIQLNVRASNTKAISFYKKMGFEEEGRLKNRVKVKGHYIDDLIMGLELKETETREDNRSTSSYQIKHYDFIPKEYEEVLYKGISEEAFRLKGFFPIQTFSIFMKDGNQSVIGGAVGALFYGSLYLDSLWVNAAFRRQRLGTELMKEVELVAKKHKTSFITLNTMDWEALPFYQRLGYSIEFTREGYEKGSKMYLLRKELLKPC